ncbi:MAG: reverse transcriptase domain-containing protein [Methylocella sp.]
MSPHPKEVKSQRALMRAWLNVKPRVTNAKDAKTRAAAGIFAQAADRSIRKLQSDLRSGKFVFEPQHGILKSTRPKLGKPKKEPRPIVVAPVRSRIVQRAILDTCQSDRPEVKRRLGSLPKIIVTPTSVGGLPGRGVPQAIGLISAAIANGAKWFVRSDLKKFFQTIPKPKVQEFLRSNIADPEFVNLFMQALATELENEDEVRELIHLFPLGEEGVPQGSALSALSANIVLAKFDEELNGRGMTTIRYLDDFIILGQTRNTTIKSWTSAQKILKSLNMECHDPNAGTGKASTGTIAADVDFLSYHIDDKSIYPSKEAREKFLRDLRDTIRNARKAISSVKDEPRRAEPRFIQSLSLLDRKIRGWGDAFSATTMGLIFTQLDSEIDKIVEAYLHWFGRVRRGRSLKHQRRLLGIALLTDTENKTTNQPASRKSSAPTQNRRSANGSAT